ncbi:MAG: hydroxymethylpyrimidine/phosphomethylpyrimidine kinase [Actinomycetota bacterium]
MATIAFAIAGSEASGGAGAQTDLKTFHQLGTFGVVALTCIVSFDPQRNWDHRFVPIDPQVIRDQIEAATAVHDIDTVKIGMLGTVPTIEAVADELAKRQWRHVVLDPVLICKGQEPGTAFDTDNALKERILPLATVVTPKHFECLALSGMESIETVEDLKETARRIHALGPRYVVAKGGAMLPGDDAVDVLHDGETFYECRVPKIGDRYVSGAGCTLAAAITAELATGTDVPEAVRIAKDVVTRAIENRITPRTPFDEVFQA